MVLTTTVKFGNFSLYVVFSVPGKVTSYDKNKGAFLHDSIREEGQWNDVYQDAFSRNQSPLHD